MQTSSQKLSAQSEQQLQEDLAILLCDIRHPAMMLDFLKTFLTESELLVLAKRLAILKRLHNNNSYEKIQKELGVSSATVSTVAQIKDKYVAQRVLETMKVHDWAEVTANKLRNWLNS